MNAIIDVADNQYEDLTIAEVTREGDSGWSIKRSDGWSFWVPATSPIAPAVGMSARFYGKGIGFNVRGLVINGVTVFYRTEADQEKHQAAELLKRQQEKRYDFEKKRRDYDRRFAALPQEFQDRISRFRANNPDFRWDLESYELFVCEQAVAIAKHVKPDAVAEFCDLGWDQQKLVVPELSDGHSGNTFAAACRLASLYLNRPELVAKEHGALCPLLGCVGYGCHPRSSAN